MKTIVENFKFILSKQKELGYYFPEIIQNGTTLEKINDTEKSLSLKFSKELIDLYTFANGTVLEADKPLGMMGLIPSCIFMNLADAESYYRSAIGYFDIAMELTKLGFPDFIPDKKIFPFSNDGAGNCYWVDLNENTPNYNKIYWTNNFGDAPDYTFSSLTAMFETIAESYRQNVFKLDEDFHLDEDYKRFALIAREINQDLDYWTEYFKE